MRLITIGMGAAAAMWVAYLLLHLPGLHAPGPVIAAVMGLIVLAGGRASSRTSPFATTSSRWTRVGHGVLVGLIAAGVNLLVLGSLLAEQPETADVSGVSGDTRPGAGIAAVGFLIAGAAVGGLGAFVSRPREQEPDATTDSPRAWAARLAIVTAISFIPLLAVGGATTSAEAGFAVPDWPGSYGANMFLFPISQMAEPRIFLEHSHRLLGSLVGLNTLVLFVVVLFTPGVSGRARIAGGALLLAVIVQGIVGGVWVLEQNPALAITHGVSAQLVFAGAVAFAVALHRRAARDDASQSERDAARRVGAPARFAFGVLVLMLVMGAWYRHTHAMHPLWTHIALAFLAAGSLVWTGSKGLGADTSDPFGRAARKVGHSMIGLVGTQFTLGVVTFLLVTTGSAAGGSGPDIPQADELSVTPTVPAVEAVLATLHQFVGATLIGTVAGAVAWAWSAGSFRRPRRAVAPAAPTQA